MYWQIVNIESIRLLLWLWSQYVYVRIRQLIFFKTICSKKFVLWKWDRTRCVSFRTEMQLQRVPSSVCLFRLSVNRLVGTVAVQLSARPGRHLNSAKYPAVVPTTTSDASFQQRDPVPPRQMSSTNPSDKWASDITRRIENCRSGMKPGRLRDRGDDQNRHRWEITVSRKLKITSAR